jgi:Arc/MetJ-type ribon-helix-helix transcriptional regulator
MCITYVLHFNFRLRKGKDDDIKRKLDDLPKYIDRSEFIRDALRYYFNVKEEKPSLLKRLFKRSK